MFTKVPPDGGWGWIIVLAGALNGVSCHKCFIRIYKLISVKKSKFSPEDRETNPNKKNEIL